MWIRDRVTGSFRLLGHQGFDPKFEHVLSGHEVPAQTAAQFLVSVEEPFVIRREIQAAVPRELVIMDEFRDVLVAPVRWEPEGLGAIQRSTVAVVTPPVVETVLPPDPRIGGVPQRAIAGVAEELGHGPELRLEAQVSRVGAVGRGEEPREQARMGGQRPRRGRIRLLVDRAL